MSDTSIFSQGPPEWLQRRALIETEQNTAAMNQLAGNLGSAIVGGMKTGSTDPETGKPMNFLTAWTTAKNLVQDPYYQGKKAMSDLSVATQKDRLKGMQEYPEWLKSTGGNPENMLDTPFNGTSQWAADMVERAKNGAWQRSTQRQAVEVRKQQVENQLEEAKIKADAQAEANKIRADAQTEAARIRAEAQKSAAETAAKSRETVADKQIEGRIDLEKIKADLQAAGGGKSVSKQEFINRQFGRAITEIYNSWDKKKDGPYSVQKASDMAEEILGSTYDKFANQPATNPNQVQTTSGKRFTVEEVK